MADFIDFTTLTRPSSPNTCLAAPPDLCGAATPDREPPVFPVAPGGLFEALKALAGERRDWRELRTDDSALALSFVAVTPLLRFKDDVDVRALPAEGRATIAVYSRSRLGYSDLGANARRVDQLLSVLHDRIVKA